MVTRHGQRRHSLRRRAPPPKAERTEPRSVTIKPEIGTWRRARFLRGSGRERARTEHLALEPDQLAE